MKTGRLLLVALALVCFSPGCSKAGTSAPSIPNTTITATVNGLLTTFNGYTEFDCEVGGLTSGNPPTLAITGYSGGCEFCGETLTVYFSDTILPATENLSCDAGIHYITYDVPGLGLYSAATNSGGSCAALEIDPFSFSEGSVVTGSFSVGNLLPVQGQGGLSIPVSGGTYSCTGLHLESN